MTTDVLKQKEFMELCTNICPWQGIKGSVTIVLIWILNNKKNANTASFFPKNKSLKKQSAWRTFGNMEDFFKTKTASKDERCSLLLLSEIFLLAEIQQKSVKCRLFFQHN